MADMLSPSHRLLYLAQLRPPLGYRLDQAIATSFSLDLLSLLMAPFSMILWECEGQDDVLRNPVAILEALRRTADRLLVFCQQGQIAVPKQNHLLYSYLEPIVVEVQPPNRKGVFHPKTWLLRFVADNDPVLYRLLCLSRNLTFDRSWDTILTLEGILEHRARGFSRNRPLADFLLSLPTMAVRPVDEPLVHRIARMAEEVRRVRFQVPEGFEEGLHFLPSGIPGYAKQPAPEWRWRCLVVSPFLSDGWLRKLQHAQGGVKNVLISRQESLDAISTKTWSLIDGSTEVFVMDEAAERPDDVATREEAWSTVSPESDLSGLHAKLYVMHDKGWDGRLRTGSANATEAAFRGHNVEFMVELRGKVSQMGMDALLGKGEGANSWTTLLRRYQRSDTRLGPDPTLQKLEAALAEARSALASSRLMLDVLGSPDVGYCLSLRTQAPFRVPETQVHGRCYPITLPSTASRNLAPLFDGAAVVFGGVSIEAITGFIAFELHAEHAGRTGHIAFVLNVPVNGMPAERDGHILRQIIGDRNRFLQYLRLLLAEGPDEAQVIGAVSAEAGQAQQPPTLREMGIPLLEELVRAYSRRPDRIDRIAQLVQDLKETPEGRGLIPDSFLELWEAFVNARTKAVP